MLGLGDAAVSAGFLLTILSSILCIIYGIATWGRKEEIEKFEMEEKKEWAKEEKEVEKML